VKCASGKGGVETVTIVKVDGRFRQVPGTERTFRADTLLIAVGLSPVNEIYEQARRFGIEAICAGDSLEIAEASAAIFSGRIAGREIAGSLGAEVQIPSEWRERWETLKRKPGKTHRMKLAAAQSGLFPVIRCVQEIPCDPCIHVCPKDMIKMKGDPVFGVPEVEGDRCTGCTRCVAACPGLAVTLVDTRSEGPDGLVHVPFEILEEQVRVGDKVDAVDVDGAPVAPARVEKVMRRRAYDRTLVVTLKVPKDKAIEVAGFRLQDPAISLPDASSPGPCPDDETIVCRCERVSAGDIRGLIRSGVRDLNQLKVLRCGMGACGGKTCESLIMRLFQEEGVDAAALTGFTTRPLVAEVNLAMLAGGAGEGQGQERTAGTGSDG
jgi:Fe-S-cluster-containing hydrogenase component 2/bacterioferritin-associated ferredoxin